VETIIFLPSKLKKMRTKKIGTIALLSAIFSFAMIFCGCKKDIQSQANEILANSARNTKEEAPAVTVHAGQSIQAAVDVASPGSIIKIEAGTYNESLVVDKANMQLVGTDDGVIIQNPGDEENGISVTDAGDGFVLKNVTVRNFKENGVLLQHVDNFLLSHVTSTNNGEY